MKRCKKCGTEYEDYATYCNTCDLPLVDDRGGSLEARSEITDIARREVLMRARKIASTVHRILGTIYIIFFAFIAMLFMMSPEPKTSGDYFITLIWLFPAAVHLVAAQGLMQNKTWARPLSIVIGILLLLNFPIGTACGVIILVQMFKKEWKID